MNESVNNLPRQNEDVQNNNSHSVIWLAMLIYYQSVQNLHNSCRVPPHWSPSFSVNFQCCSYKFSRDCHPLEANLWYSILHKDADGTALGFGKPA